MLFVKRNIDKLTKVQCNSQVAISSIRSKELMHLTRTILHASILSMKVREQLKSLRKQCTMLNSRLLAMVDPSARLLLSSIQKVIKRSKRRHSRKLKRKQWDCTRLWKHICWQILISMLELNYLSSVSFYYLNICMATGTE